MAMVDLNIYIYTYGYGRFKFQPTSSSTSLGTTPSRWYLRGGLCRRLPRPQVNSFSCWKPIVCWSFFYSGVLTMFNVMLMCLLFLISSTIIIDSLDEISGENNEFPSVSGNHHLKGPLGQNVPGTDSRFHFHRFQPPKHAEKYFQDNRSMMFSPESPGFQLFDFWGCQNVVMTSGLEGPRCTLHLDVSWGPNCGSCPAPKQGNHQNIA